jgi:hypothetical protein
MKKILLISLFTTIILSGCLKAPEKKVPADSAQPANSQSSQAAPLSGENTYDPKKQTRVFYSPSDLTMVETATSASSSTTTKLPLEKNTPSDINQEFHRSESIFPITSDQLVSTTKEKPASTATTSNSISDSSQKP